jgi:hypothetical protein
VVDGGWWQRPERLLYEDPETEPVAAFGGFHHEARE